MDLILLVLVLAIVGFVIWLITTQIPMPANWARAIQIFALVVIVIYLITRFLNLPNVLPGR
jgi:hypothetical protein